MRLPVFLARRPAEPSDLDLAAFYERLLPEGTRDLFRDGGWRSCEMSGWPDNQSHLNVLAWCWAKDAERSLVVVNYREDPSQARIHVPWDDMRGKAWRLHDALSGEVCDRSGDEMRDAGLFVDLGPWQCHLFRMESR